MFVVLFKVLKRWEQNWFENSHLDWNNLTRLILFWPKEQIWLKRKSLQVPFTVITRLQNPIIVKFWSLEWINQQFYWSRTATEIWCFFSFCHLVRRGPLFKHSIHWSLKNNWTNITGDYQSLICFPQRPSCIV